MVQAFIQGIMLAFSLVIPLGPQNTFIFNQAIGETKYRAVLPIVAVSALCDALLILLAVIGMDLFLHISKVRSAVSLVGIVFLVFMGYRMWTQAAVSTIDSASHRMSRWKQILLTMSLSLLNPHAIMDTFLVIGGISVVYIGAEKHAFTIGCIVTDILWFILLSLCGFYLKKLKHSAVITFAINKISALFMWFIAIQLMITFFEK